MLSSSRFAYVFLVILVLITAKVGSIVARMIPIIVVILGKSVVLITRLIVCIDSICISDRLIIPKCTAKIMIRIHILWFIALHASVMDALVLLMRESSTAVIVITRLPAIILGNINILIIFGYFSFEYLPRLRCVVWVGFTDNRDQWLTELPDVILL